MTTARDYHLQSLGWLPTNPRMVTHKNEVYLGLNKTRTTRSHVAACVPRKSVGHIDPCKGYLFIYIIFYIISFKTLLGSRFLGFATISMSAQKNHKNFCPALTKLALDLHVNFCLFVCLCACLSGLFFKASNWIIYWLLTVVLATYLSD